MYAARLHAKLAVWQKKNHKHKSQFFFPFFSNMRNEQCHKVTFAQNLVIVTVILCQQLLHAVQTVLKNGSNKIVVFLYNFDLCANIYIAIAKQCM